MVVVFKLVEFACGGGYCFLFGGDLFLDLFDLEGCGGLCFGHGWVVRCVGLGGIWEWGDIGKGSIGFI